MRDAAKARAAFIKGLPMTELQEARRAERARRNAEQAARDALPSTDRSVGQVWRVDDHDRVQYFAAPQPSPPR